MQYREQLHATEQEATVSSLNMYPVDGYKDLVVTLRATRYAEDPRHSDPLCHLRPHKAPGRCHGFLDLRLMVCTTLLLPKAY